MIFRIDDISGIGWMTFGSHGTGIGEFQIPWGIYVDSDGKIYIADQNNHRIVQIDDITGSGWIEYGTGPGSGIGEFFHPACITNGTYSNIYITDAGNCRIVRINDMTGAGWAEYGSYGSGIGEFYCPTGICVVPASLGVAESTAKKPNNISISAYPNPFNSAIRIQVSRIWNQESGNLSCSGGIEIYDLRGNIVGTTRWVAQQKGDATHRPYIWSPDESITSGVYLVRARMGDETISKRIVYLK